MKILRWLLLFSLITLHLEAFPKKNFHLSPEPIDVVIPCSSGDRDTIEQCVQGIRTYGQNIRRIIIVSKERLTQSAEWFDEKNYPFSKADIALELFNQNTTITEKYLKYPKNRIGWIYQQFLKLYAPFVIPNISSNVLMLDADVIFLKPMKFMEENGEPYFTVSYEYHKPYFQHMSRLIPGLRRVHSQYSGVSHHMLFQKAILADLHEMIYAFHRLEPWKAICKCIDFNELPGSSFSEYEIYFNYTLQRCNQARVQEIKWYNCINKKNTLSLKDYQDMDYAYVAWHNWAR